MAEKASDGLPYGQFGQAVYDPDDGAWHFGRLPRDEDSLQRIGEAEVVISPSASQPLSLPDGDPAGPSRRREKQTKALIRQVPELQPAADLLPELARVSEAVENATARHDPSRGHLLARGEIYDEVAKKPVPAIAFPCGCNGGDMRIIRTAKQRQGWTDDKDSWIEVPTMSDYEVTWRGPGVPISSVVFAHPYEKGPSYLAVRLQVETLIFRPVARKLDSTGRSRMEVNFLLFISIDDTGGRPHADISFNSWVNGEFAIVDDAGSFSVWEVPGRDSHRANMINEGRNIITDRDSAKIPDDGWARVTWVADAETLCVCTRHELLLVPGNGQHDRASVRRVDIDAKLRGGIGWIVDIACVWNSPRLLFVLTSSHILVVGVDRSIDNETGWKMAASVRHHRNPDDLTLIMHLLSTEDGIVMLLRSSVSPSITQIYFALPDFDTVAPQLPHEWVMPVAAVKSGFSAYDMLDLHLQKALTSDSVRLRSEHEQTFALSQSAASFCFVFFLSKTLAVSRVLYGTRASRDQGVFSSVPRWNKNVSKVKSKRRDRVASFIVGDDEDSNIEPIEAPVSDYTLRRRKEAVSRDEADWTVNYELAVRRLNDLDAAENVSIDQTVDKASGVMQTASRELMMPTQTLWELEGKSIAIDDIENSAARLDALDRAVYEQTATKADDEEAEEVLQTVVAPVAPRSMARLGLPGLQDLSSTVETIRESWITPSTGYSTTPTHASRTRHAHRLAAEVALASRTIRTRPRIPDDDPEKSQSQSQSCDLPYHSPWANRPTQLPLSQPSTRASTPALPTPSASAGASEITSASSVPTIAPHIARLSRYTTFANPTQPAPLPRALQRVLSHWQPGTDPSTYDWRRATHQLSQRGDTAEDNDDMTTKEREALQKKAERYKRRQRREAEESRRLQVLSRQVPEVVSASQPAHAVERQVAAGSSQTVGPSQRGFGAASQVVPGRHGGRPPARKKRKSGF